MARPPRAADAATRERLLASAVRLFAERGFKRVTVRDICRSAGANVASVNYHFGGKGGLYREVLRAASDVMRATNDLACQAGAGLPPDERLRRYIRVSLRAVVTQAAPSWIPRLIHREIADPTPAFDALVDQGVRPRVEALSAIVAEILGCRPDDERLPRCVASIQAQWMLYLPNPISSRLKPNLRVSRANLDQVADHIAEFSLAGIRAIARLH